MKLNVLYTKLGPAQKAKVRVVGDVVLYDNGTTIYEALWDRESDDLIPRTVATRNALNALGP